MKNWQLLRDVCLWQMLHTQGRDAHLCLFAFIFMSLLHKTKKCETGIYSGTRCAPVPSRFLSSCPYYIQLETKDWKLLRDEMCTCAFSLSIFMSFLYTNTNERLEVGQGRVPLAYVAHTGTRCAPVPSRFLSSCPCYTKQKCETGSYSGTRCAPVPSRFLSSCPYFTKPETKDGSYSGTRCYPKILKLSYLPHVPSLPYPHIYHRSFSVQVSLFVLVMTHCYWVLLRPPTKVGQSGGVAYIYIYYNNK